MFSIHVPSMAGARRLLVIVILAFTFFTFTADFPKRPKKAIRFQGPFQPLDTQSKPKNCITCCQQCKKAKKTITRTNIKAGGDPSSHRALGADQKDLQKGFQSQCQVNAVVRCYQQQRFPRSNVHTSLSQHIARLLGHTLQAKALDTTCVDADVVSSHCHFHMPGLTGL